MGCWTHARLSTETLHKITSVNQHLVIVCAYLINCAKIPTDADFVAYLRLKDLADARFIETIEERGGLYIG